MCYALKYTPAGFKAGLVISLASVVMIAAVIAGSSLIRKKKEAKASEAQAAENVPSAPVQAGASESIEEIPVSVVITETEASSENSAVPENKDGEGSTPEVSND